MPRPDPQQQCFDMRSHSLAAFGVRRSPVFHRHRNASSRSDRRAVRSLVRARTPLPSLALTGAWRNSSHLSSSFVFQFRLGRDLLGQ